MRTAFFCILFLTLALFVPSAQPLGCRCLSANKNVRLKRIADVVTIDPRPDCRITEVIAKLIDGSSLCLDPASRFTKAVIAMKQRQLSKKSAGLKSTAASATVTPTPQLQTSRQPPK